jgi:Family of unknown function (DUF6508)
MVPLKPITASDIEVLLVHRERLRALNGRFLEKWGGGGRKPSGVHVMPWPDYPDAVTEFFSAAGEAPWSDHNYSPSAAGKKVRDLAPYTNASLDEVRTMLTWCTRGERFCDGHWAAVLDDGTVFRLLDRLESLLATACGGG